MFTTRRSLLERLRGDGDAAWEEFTRFYAPFLVRVAERIGLRGQDVDEVVQAVLVDLHRSQAVFQYDRSRGRFRDYLKKMVVTRLSKMLREVERVGTPTGRLPERWSEDLEQHWEQEYRDHVLREALAMVRQQVEPTTYQAFDLYALQGVDARAVARFLGVSTSAVYVAKSRVLERLKAAVREVMDE